MAITLSALDMFRNASAWTDNTKLKAFATDALQRA